METGRLQLKPMRESDETAFVNGIADHALRVAYGIPKDLDTGTAGRIFRQFSNLPGAYSMIERQSGNMVGFLLEVEPELPQSIAERLSGNGRTLAFAVFPPYQRHGYMEEALNAYIQFLFRDRSIAYIHCGHFTENEPSSRLLQKLGFSVFADHAVKDRIIVDRIKRRGNDAFC